MHFEKRGLAKLLKKFAIGLCLLIFVSSGFTVTEYFLEHRDYLKTVRKIESISAQAEQLDQIRTSLIILKEHLKQRSHAWDSVQSLFHSLPQDISIKSMGYDSRRLNIRGYASNLSKIFEFAGVLQKNPLFSKIETKYARQNTLGRSEYSEFSIECWFQP